MTESGSGIDGYVWIAIVLAIFAIVLISVGGVLRRAPSDSATGGAGIWLWVIGAALGITAIVVAIAGFAGVI